MAQGGSGGAERSTAIVLFTDVVRSTELRARLGEDAAEELRRKHDSMAAVAVQASRGKLVKNLGDGIMATFAGASDAVRAAVAIQQAIDRHNRSGPAALEVRIGISAGDVAFEGDDCFGAPVIEAARLCGAAGGGQILASEMVRWLARSSESTYTPIGHLELKGLPEPVPAVRVGWEPLHRSSVPLPAFLTDMGRIFVGRDGELERLHQLWKETAAGELRVALVAGEPGVGKTRLAAELAQYAHDAGATVLAGRCDEDLGVPYQPFVEALRQFVEHAPRLGAHLGRYGAELVRLAPELTELVPGLPAPLRSDPDTERYRLFDAVAAWLEAASAAEPLLIVLDDLQWAAKPTLMLLRHIVRAARGHVLILGTYRDSELSHDHPLVDVVAALRREGAVERLSLIGLDDDGVRALVEAASGRMLDEGGLALARAVYQETEGNPFFVREVLRHLAETGAVERNEGGWTTRLPVDQLGVPEGVREAVGHRLSRLSGEARQALRFAAVVGPEFELSVVQAAGGLDEEALLAAVEEAAGARLVIEVSATRFRFAHALVRATLYESLTAARKVALHRKVAVAIEAVHAGALNDFVPALAHHWAKASAPVIDVARAVDYARQAGDLALAQVAHDEAAAYYASGLDLLDAAGADPADPRRIELLIGRGESQRWAGDPGYRETLLDATRLAAQVGDTAALVRGALANTLGHIWTRFFHVDTDRVEALEAALAVVAPDDLLMRARLLATLGLELAWAHDPSHRLMLSDEALQIARSLGDPQTLAHVLLARDYTISFPDNAAERFAATTELLALAEQLGDPVLASRALSLRFKAAVELADVAEAERCLAENQLLVDDLGQPVLAWAALHHQATLRVLHVDSGAEAALTAADEFGETVGQVEIFSVARRISCRFDQGRAEELEAWFHQAAEQTHSPLLRAIHAHILVETGRAELASPVFDELAATGFAHPTNNVAWLCYAAECAWLSARLGRQEAVPELRSRLEPFADQLVVGALAGWVAGCVAYYLGLVCTTVGDWPKAEEHFAAAMATDERVGAPAGAARTGVEWARMLLARAGPGDAERAGDLLRQALATARQLGLANIERGAVELLARP